ncbi:MAG: fluoride efflux transporter CrcB [Flavobacteriales bacterium]|nr:fluoride efflux transporter CrcB [Flavobacteriales bacterium]
MPNLLAVFIGGGIGSVLRYLIGKGTVNIIGDFPVGTLIANVCATAILAFALSFWGNGDSAPSWLSALVIAGFCGGFSTFSTFSVDTVKLYTSGHTGLALANVLISVIGCAFIAWMIVKKL